MWFNFLARHRKPSLSSLVPPRDIEEASSVLFAVFARYGDSVVAFKAIDEFMRRYPGKQYILITTHQAAPYASALMASSMRRYVINKRRNPIRLWRLVRYLKNNPPDLGFNPWSHGAESEYFVSLCRKHLAYRAFAKFERHENLYRRARAYLGLPDPPAAAPARLPGAAKLIVVCPFSTDIRKSLDGARLEDLVLRLRGRFAPSTLVVAGLRTELKRIGKADATSFTLNKSRRASERFVALLRSADLFVGIDAGPLHLAAALGVPTIALFGPTAPETILDRNSRIVSFR